MKVARSIRFRMVVGFTLAGLVLGLVFSGIIYAVLHDLEDEIFYNQMGVEAAAFERRYAEDPATPLPQTQVLQSFPRLDAVTDLDLRKDLDRSPGKYELEWRDKMLWVGTYPGTAERYFLLINGAGIEPLESRVLDRILAVIALLITFLGGWLGWVIGRRVIAPIVHLAGVVERVDPARLPQKLAGPFYNDEVGLLATALEQAWQRSARFMEREQAFTRDASHELRTPVTVARGAVELIERLAMKGKPITQPLRRLRRSILDMENLITTFLFLGREPSPLANPGQCEVGEVLDQVIQQNSYLLEDKEVRVVREGLSFNLAVDEVILSVLLANLIRNAFQYTDHGQVCIRLSANRVEVIDSGRGMVMHDCETALVRGQRGRHSKGAGLGLSICRDFCDRFGWQLRLSSELGRGTTACLDFSGQEKDGGPRTSNPDHS